MNQLSGQDPEHVPDYRRLFSLDQRVFVVVGGGAGIGRQSSHALAQAGATVVVVDTDPAAAAAVAAEVGGIALPQPGHRVPALLAPSGSNAAPSTTGQRDAAAGSEWLDMQARYELNRHPGPDGVADSARGNTAAVRDAAAGNRDGQGVTTICVVAGA
jgi:NAD(P)-dependent dehydrogenase (short-subunit alcohol dehydrogenase family)